MLVTKSVLKLIFVLSNYQMCTFRGKKQLIKQTAYNFAPFKLLFYLGDRV